MDKLNLILKSKKGQAWGMDLMVATVIFTFALLSFYIYSLNTSNGVEEKVESLSYDGRSITNNLLSEGTPENWDNSTVVQMGILTDGKINETKLELFYNITQEDYERTKRLFNTRFNYYFFLDENITVNSSSSQIEIEGIGNPSISVESEIPGIADNLIKISRVTVYKNKPIGAKLYIWD